MQSRKIATCGLLCALSIVVMMLGSFIGIGTYAAPLLAFWLLLPAQEMFGNKAALTAFFAVAVIGLMILPDRELALFYCAFGWWPVAKTYVDRIPGTAVRTIVKLVIYLAVVLLMMYAVMSVIGLEALNENLAILFFLPILKVPFTWIDLVVIPVGALFFFYCDSSIKKIRPFLTAKVKKLMRIH